MSKINLKEIVKTVRSSARDLLRAHKISDLQAELVRRDNDIVAYNKEIEETNKVIKAQEFAIAKANLEKDSGLVNPDYETIVKRATKNIESLKKDITAIEKNILEVKKAKTEIRKKQKDYAEGKIKFDLENINRESHNMLEDFFGTRAVELASAIAEAEEEVSEEETKEAEEVATAVEAGTINATETDEDEK